MLLCFLEEFHSQSFKIWSLRKFFINIQDYYPISVSYITNCVFLSPISCLSVFKLNVASYLQVICLVENFRTDLKDFVTLLTANACDIRKSILYLQFWIRSGGGTLEERPLSHCRKQSVIWDHILKYILQQDILKIVNSVASYSDF